MSPLCHLLRQTRDPSSPVALGWDESAEADQVVRWEEFRRDVAGLRDRLGSEPAGSWVLLAEDPYAFAVGLFALWHSGRRAVSPPNRQPGTLRALHSRSAGVLSDRADWIPESRSLHPLIDGKSGDPASLEPLDADAVAMELFTSGTTGREKPVEKRVRHLECEVRELAATWDERVGNATFFSAASHQHLYGLLFGVLWPLSSGHAFERHNHVLPGELIPRMQKREACVLASVPTHLKYLARHPMTPSLRRRCRAVFSSGGPLPADTAHEIARGLDSPPFEVLGSTETGGIAWRCQHPSEPSPRWTPFSQVSVSRSDDGLLRVRSPFVSVDGGDDGAETGDRISVHGDGTFSLEGRSGRIAKIGGKRLDLSQMEASLLARTQVDEVALSTVDRNQELRVAAVVVPSDEGWESVRREGQRFLVNELRAGLAEMFDPVLHPRYWRVSSSLPTTPHGKVTHEALRSLFRAPDTDNAVSDRPEILEQIRGNDFLERSCRVPRNLGCFDGHFPNNPLVPGVVQLDWAMELVAELIDAPPRVDTIKSLKFLAPMGPDVSFRLQVRAASPRQIDFRIWGNDVEYARGHLRLFAAETPAP